MKKKQADFSKDQERRKKIVRLINEKGKIDLQVDLDILRNRITSCEK